MLGKGLFFARRIFTTSAASTLITIEDPEIGLRLWKNGIRLGIIEGSLIEEVPTSLPSPSCRKRWVGGFFQTLKFHGGPMDRMDFSFIEKIKAWLIFLPCVMLAFNCLGLPLSIWAAVTWYNGTAILPDWCSYWSMANIGLCALFMTGQYWRTWLRTRLIMDTTWQRVRYMLRVNPLFMQLWWLFWAIPLGIGYGMYRNNLGLVWERTLKKNDNRLLVRDRVARDARMPNPAARIQTVESRLTSTRLQRGLDRGIHGLAPHRSVRQAAVEARPSPFCRAPGKRL